MLSFADIFAFLSDIFQKIRYFYIIYNWRPSYEIIESVRTTNAKIYHYWKYEYPNNKKYKKLFNESEIIYRGDLYVFKFIDNKAIIIKDKNIIDVRYIFNVHMSDIINAIKLPN